MAWTAELMEKQRVPNSVNFRIKFTNGTDIYEEWFEIKGTSSPEAMLRREVKRRVNQLEELENYDPTLGPFDYSDLPVPPEDPPTQGEIDRVTYMSKARKLRSMFNAVELGVLTGSEPEFDQLRTYLQTNIDPSYITEAFEI